MFSEDDLLPLSALQHFLFCERQAALIHLEQVWADNPFTVEGTALHEKADVPGTAERGGVRTARGLALRSLRLGLSGRADTVELHPDEGGGVAVPGVAGRWRLFPVEYKRGKPKSHRADEVQLCAQALCLEEMLGATIPEGALFYGQTRRRTPVSLDDELRRLTEESAVRLHRLIASGVTPVAAREAKCEACSLVELCRPEAAGKSVRRYLDALYSEAGES